MESVPSSFSNILEQYHLVAIIELLALGILLVFSALVSGAEVAFFSLTPGDIEKAKESKEKKDKQVVRLLEKPKELLATILISNNFLNVGIVIFSTYLTSHFFNLDVKSLIGFLIQVVAITFMILMFGEVIPKVYANLNALKFAQKMAAPIEIMQSLFRVISIPLLNSTNFIEDKLQKNKGNISVSHLEHALELTSDDETTKEEQKILEGIVSFGNTDTKQIMHPRIDMFAINANEKFSFVIEEIIKNGYSRIPVYKKNIDSIIGILYIKDLLPHINAKDNFNWVRLIKPAFFVPENKKIDDLLNDFREKKTHLAIVVDEYGGTSGLISMEDIIEEIVGDISDEFDIDQVSYSKIDSSNFVFEGKTTLKDFYRVTDIEDETQFEDEKGESDTLAGFILEIAGRFPEKGEIISFNSFDFTIEAVDKKRIKQVKVSLKSSENNA
ncbi:MAG: gliding motility-associated protein GldE [Flavobacteriales bacterium]|nr:gliding motility-associated protein GldE [Flavobacteriales bacterium]